MAEILSFSGYTRHDINPDDVLEAAKGELKQVLIIGEAHNGDLFVAASTANKATLLWAIEEFKFKLLSEGFCE